MGKIPTQWKKLLPHTKTPFSILDLMYVAYRIQISGWTDVVQVQNDIVKQTKEY